MGILSGPESGSLLRNGLMIEHEPLMNKILLLALVIISGCFWLARKSTDPDTLHTLWFSLSLVMAGFIVLNQQVVTGFTIWPHHFSQYTTLFALIGVVVATSVTIGVTFPYVFRVGAYTAILLSVVYAGGTAFTYTSVMDEFRSLQQFAPAFTWLNAHAPEDCVALVAESEAALFTDFVPGFTHCNVYYTSYVVGVVPEERSRHNYFAQLYVRGVAPAEIETYFKEHQHELLTYFYRDWSELFVTHDMTRINALEPTLAAEYRQFVSGDVRSRLTEYRLDYLIDAGMLDGDVIHELGATKVFEHAGITIYEL